MNNNGILLFGGTFDPIHHGHLIIARAAAEQLQVEKVILIPSAQPPHKTNAAVSTTKDRLRMTQLAVAGDTLFEVSDCELQRRGPSYTLETVRYFRGLYGAEIQLYWLIGADSVGELLSWYRIEQLVDECIIVTASRPDYHLDQFSALQPALKEKQIKRIKKHILNTPMIDISATEIRRRAGQNLSIYYLTTPKVANYIINRRLYKNE
ncbi:MAG: hypothetical protein AMJ79_05720 [Phycisphaerae bacterium SM23_30]|nr:MAG: hypothetical protein AMJ79_05720 [Phycisphaerae bacterium SM23_30]